jgi:hypothetical protein
MAGTSVAILYIVRQSRSKQMATIDPSCTPLVLFHAHYDETHLAEVVESMRSKGAPRLRGVNCGSYVQLIEGCHRARAANALGLTIEVDLVELTEDDMPNLVSDMFPDIDFDPCDAVTWDMVTTLNHEASEASYELNLQWEVA